MNAPPIVRPGLRSAKPFTSPADSGPRISPGYGRGNAKAAGENDAARILPGKVQCAGIPLFIQIIQKTRQKRRPWVPPVGKTASEGIGNRIVEPVLLGIRLLS